MALTKVTQVSLLAITSVTSNTTTVGSAVDVSTYYAADVKIRMGRATGTAFTTGPTVRIEGTYKTSPTANDWVSLAEFQMAVGANIANQTVSTQINAADTAWVLAAGTNFAAGDYVFAHDPTLGNSEWARVVSVSGGTITVEEGAINSHVITTSSVRDQAEQYHALLDLTSIQKIRLVVSGANSGQAVVCQAELGAVSAL